MTKNMNRGERLHSEVRAEILRMIDSEGKKCVVDRLRSIVANSKMDPSRTSPGEMLGVVQKSPEHRFGQLWHRLLEALARKQGSIIDVPCEDCGTEERHRTADEFHHPKQHEIENVTAIVRRVGDLEFRLPSEDLTGAKAARITLTELARKLGYSDKSMLKRLADRNVEYLARFGSSVMVTVVVSRDGRGSVTYQEPSYNRHQVMYLVTKSETPVANDLTCELIEGYEKLRTEFERVVTQPAVLDQALTQLLTQQSEMMGGIMQGLTNLTLAIAGRQPDTQLPQAQPSSEKTDRRTHWKADAELASQREHSDESTRDVTNFIRGKANIRRANKDVSAEKIMKKSYHHMLLWISENHGHDYYRDMEESKRDMSRLEWAKSKGILHLFRLAAEAILPLPLEVIMGK